MMTSNRERTQFTGKIGRVQIESYLPRLATGLGLEPGLEA